MSAAKRQRTCAACGGPFTDGEPTDLEPLIDGVIRYLSVHPGHSTFGPPRRKQAAARVAEQRAAADRDGDAGTDALAA